jgi:argininosuccinate lyase
MFSPVYTERVLEPAYRNWKRLYAADAMAVHRAHLVGLAESGILDRETASRIAAAVDAIELGFAYPDSIPEGVEDLYFVFERELEARIGADRAAYLHMARSRNDMDTTVFRMALRRGLLALCAHALAALRATIARARRGGAELTVLYTHGQPANVSTMGHYLAAFAAELAEDLEALALALEAADRSTMGACAITGTGFPLDRGRVAALLGFPGFVLNTYAAISTSHWLSRPAAALEELLADYGRLVADLLHKASCEVGLVDFPDSLVQGSSIMPQKRNPVILEHARIQAGMAAGACASIRVLYRNVAYQDVNEAADAPVTELIAAMAAASSATALISEIIENVSSNQAKARRIALDFGVTTTELADTMVREAGIGFRTAHAVCAAYLRAGKDYGTLRAAFREKTGRELPLGEERVAAALEPENFVAARRLPGGPAAEGMAPAYEELEAAAGRIEGRLSGTERRIRAASKMLEAAWSGLRG